MITGITILTIFSGVASLLGFAYIFFGSRTAAYKRLCACFLGLAAVWSGYVALVPGSATERNVAAKIAYYQLPSSPNEKNLLLVQNGDLSYVGGCSPVEVQFPVPFSEAPKVELVNFKGYESYLAPEVGVVTPFKVEFVSGGIGCPPVLPEIRTYRWIAAGPALNEISGKRQ